MTRPKSLITRRSSRPRMGASFPQTESPTTSPIPPSFADSDYFGHHATVTSFQGDKRSSQRSRSKIRAYLYGSSHESSQSAISSEDEDEQHNSLASAARGAKKRLSRTGSSIMQLSSAKTSTNYLSCSSSLNLLTNSDPEENARLAHEIKQKAHLDSLAAENHVSSPQDEDKHVDAVMAPMRRKSLYTPGIATRHPSDILRKPPPPRSLETQADRDYYYNPAYPDSSPLSKIAAMSLAEDGRSTPSSFTHLGGLKLGTLRVTNGTEPSQQVASQEVCSPTHTALSTNPDDYHTASEGSEDDTVQPLFYKRRSLSVSSDKTLSNVCNRARSNYRPSEELAYRSEPAPSLTQNASSDQTTAMANDYILELTDSPFSARLSESSPHEDEAIHMPKTPPDAQRDWLTVIKQTQDIQLSCQSRDDAFARLNRENLPTFHHGSPDDTNVNVTRPTSVLINTSSSDSGYSSNTSLRASQGTIRTPLTKLQKQSRIRRSISRPRMLSRSRTMPNFVAEEHFQGPHNDQSSGTEPTLISIPFDTLPESGPEPVQVLSHGTVIEARKSLQAPAETRGRKLQKSRSKSQPSMKQVPVQSYQDLSDVHIPRVPSIIAARHAERLAQFPLLDQTFPSANHSLPDQRSSSPVLNTAPVRFPSPANALEAATVQHSAEYQALIEDDTRLNCDPGVELDRPTASQGMSSDGRPDQALGQPPSEASNSKKAQKRLVKEQKKNEKRLIKEEKELEKRLTNDRKDLERRKSRGEKRARSRSRSLSRASSWIRGKSSERPLSEIEARTVISDFGTVVGSIGSSPYDIARATKPRPESSQPTIRNARRLSSVEAKTNPTLMRDATCADSNSLRGRRTHSVMESFVPRDAGQAKAIARLRPQTMCGDIPPVPDLSAADCYLLDRDWGLSRPHSSNVSGAEKEGLGTTTTDDFQQPQKSVRPISMSTDVPPVPALPSASQVQSREAKWARSRPQSMVVDTNKTTIPEASALLPGKRRSRTEQSTDVCHKSSTSAENDVDGDDKDASWEQHRLAWRRRRQSAGEALSQKNSAELRYRNSQVFAQEAKPALPDAQPDLVVSREPTPAAEPVAQPQPLRKRVASDKRTPRAASVPDARPIQDMSIDAAATKYPDQYNVDRFAGRFEGGLQYAYEAGYGLGGSAGTRNARTQASRKSVAVSHTYGVDLSDVPLFVLPLFADGR